MKFEVNKLVYKRPKFKTHQIVYLNPIHFAVAFYSTYSLTPRSFGDNTRTKFEIRDRL